MEGELQRLGGLGITALHLDAAATSGVDNGNLVGLTGRYDRADGSTQVLADVWLATAPLPARPASGAAAASPVALQTRVTDLVQSLGRFTERRDDWSGSTGPTGLAVKCGHARRRVSHAGADCGRFCRFGRSAESRSGPVIVGSRGRTPGSARHGKRTMLRRRRAGRINAHCVRLGLCKLETVASGP